MSRTYVIAEAGVNHNGDRDMAFALVKIAAEAGADAVKFQTFVAEQLAAASLQKAEYQKVNTGSDEGQLAMLKKLELPRDWHAPLQDYANSLGITFISTAFDLDSLAFLETLDLPFYKIPSGEVTNAALLIAFAQTGRPVVLSTGMASIAEVEQALALIAYGYCHPEAPSGLDAVQRFWSTSQAADVIRQKVSLLHCTSRYPTRDEEVNLRAMDSLAAAFGVPVGYSDHTEGLVAATAAVARGAHIIEKHFTLDKTLPGPDHRASLSPQELTELITQIRQVEAMLGRAIKVPCASEWDTRAVARQNIIVTRPIAAGETFSRANLATARAGKGVSALYYWDYMGKQAEQAYQPGDVL
jgi:N-acetylneuraminate synthase